MISQETPPKAFEKVRALWPNADHSQFVKSGSLTWHVQRFGNPEAPVILMIHGTGGSTHSMAPLAAQFAQHYQIVIPDLPGHGFTAQASSRLYTLPAMASAVSHLLSMLDVEPQIVIGHSAGAAIAIQMALRNEVTPKTIFGLNAALEPIEGNAILSPLAKALFVNPLVPRLVSFQARHTALTKSLLGNTGSNLTEELKRYYDVLLANPDHIAGALGMMANWDLKPLIAELPSLNVPLCLIANTGDKMVPSRVSKKTAATAKTARYVEIPRGGHLYHETDPAPLAGLITDCITSG